MRKTNPRTRRFSVQTLDSLRGRPSMVYVGYLYWWEYSFYHYETMAGANATISEGLGRYSIGEKLRTLRLRKSLGLVELGQHTGLSAALLSKLERGKLFPTLPTLLRIAMVFGVGLDFFFTDERKRRVVGWYASRSGCGSQSGREYRMCRITLSAWITAPRNENLARFWPIFRRLGRKRRRRIRIPGWNSCLLSRGP